MPITKLKKSVRNLFHKNELSFDYNIFSSICAAKYSKTNARFYFQTDEKVWNGKAPILWEWINLKNSPKHPIILHIWSNYFDQRQALWKSGCWLNLSLKNLDRNEID